MMTIRPAEPILPGTYTLTGTIGMCTANWPALLRAEGVPFRGHPLTRRGRLNRRGHKALRMAMKRQRREGRFTVTVMAGPLEFDPEPYCPTYGTPITKSANDAMKGLRQLQQELETPPPTPPFRVLGSEAVPKDEAWIIQNGKRIGRITGISPSEES